MNRHQAEVVAYVQEENRVLREQLRGRRLRFTEAQRRLLTAVAAPANENVGPVASIACRERLGGILSYYYRPAA